MAGDPRSTRRWRKLRAQVLAARPYCEMRGPRCSVVATTVDHVVPLDAGGSPWDWSNLRPACAACNFRAGALLATRKRVAKRSAAGLPSTPRRRRVVRRPPRRSWSGEVTELEW